MIAPSYDREITKHLCEQIVMLRNNPRVIARDTFYLLSHFKSHKDAETAADIVREFGYYARVINDYGSAVVIKPKKGRR
jgi:hypothetical protein